MGKSKKKKEKHTGGEEQNSQVEDEMLMEKEQKMPKDVHWEIKLKNSIKHLRNENGDVWTANLIKKQFPSIDRLFNL